MLWAGSIHLEPGIDTLFVVDTEAGQPGNSVPLIHVVQADGTFPGILGQHILVVRDVRLGEAHDQVRFNFIRGHELGADRALEAPKQVWRELHGQRLRHPSRAEHVEEPLSPSSHIIGARSMDSWPRGHPAPWDADRWVAARGGGRRRSGDSAGKAMGRPVNSVGSRAGPSMAWAGNVRTGEGSGAGIGTLLASHGR